MKVRDLKLALDQYDDDALVHIELGMGTVHRINKCIIEPSTHSGDLYAIRYSTKDIDTSGMVLLIE